jgi:outer membrane protein OmpA-like peptidoglycan-associated protein
VFNKKNLILIILCIQSFMMPNRSSAIQSINVQTFNPSVSDHFVLIEDALMTEWPKMSKYYFGANYNWVDNPLVATDFARQAQVATIIDSVQTFDFFVGFRPDKQLALYFGFPIHTVTYDPNQLVLPGVSSTTALGDMKIMGKIRLNREDTNTSWAIVPEFHLPTGNTENFVSDASTYVALRLALERTFEKWTFGGNIGMISAPNAKYSTLDFSKRLIMAAGGFVPFNDHWGMSVEFSAQNPLPFNENLNPNELYGGLRYASSDNLVFTMGGSLGKLSGPTGQNARIIAGLRYTWFEHKEAPAPERYFPMPTPAQTATPTPIVVVAPKPAPKAVLRAKQIELLMPVNFEFNGDQLAKDSKEILNDVADIMKRNPKAYRKILIDGHTDRAGSDQYNLKLSIRRARSVRTYLISQGISSKVVEARGFGERKPKVPYKDPKADEINRRVEFIVVK